MRVAPVALLLSARLTNQLGCSALRTASAYRSRPPVPRRFATTMRPASVSGSVYTSEGGPEIKLFTKKGFVTLVKNELVDQSLPWMFAFVVPSFTRGPSRCTLCDKVKDVLVEVREVHPHSLVAVDITDKENREWFDKVIVESVRAWVHSYHHKLGSLIALL